MESFIQRYAQLCEAQGRRFLIHADRLFAFINPYTVTPLGPAMWDCQLSTKEANHVLASLRGRILLLTGGLFSGGCDQWYAVICDRFTPLDEMKSKARSEIRRGLRQCEVRRIDGAFLADNGYEVMVEACKSYGAYQGTVPSESQFRKSAIEKHAFEDLVHYWGVFCRSTGKLVAFGENWIFGKIEASYSTIKLHPEALAMYAGYALVYAMNEYYLGQEGFQYANDGWRSVLHETQVQDFLIRKFVFRREPSRLRVSYRGGLSVAVKAAYPFRGVLGKADHRLAALFALEEISRACSSKVGAARSDVLSRESLEGPPRQPFQE
jgi:hypothetical protein